eukprot:scaffold6950_cov31-Phaeocystis_antarctica.AAC.1
MGATVDLSVQWSTDADGTMRSSAGETIVDYRPCGRAASRTSSAARRALNAKVPAARSSAAVGFTYTVATGGGGDGGGVVQRARLLDA